MTLDLESVHNVAIYLRKSRNEEGLNDKDVLLKHRNQLVEFVEKTGWKYDIFQEIGSSDTIDFRPKFKSLLERVKNNCYQGVVVIDFDRITRGDSYEYGYIKKIFAESKTLVLTPYGEQIDLSDEMNILNDVKATLGRYEYLQTKKRLREGKIRSAKLGYWVNGPAPIGYNYDRNTKKLVIDTNEAEIVRTIFNQYTEGVPLQRIGFNLNCNGYRTKKGSYFSEVKVQRILRNQVYIGNNVFGKSEGSGHLNKKTKPLRFKDENEWIIIENAHPTIITKTQFDLAQIRLDQNQKIPVKARQPVFTLSGLLRCKRCNSILRFTKKELVERGKVLYVRKCQKADPFGSRCKNIGCDSLVILRAIREQLGDFQEDLTRRKDNLEMNTTSRVKQEIETVISEISNYDESFKRLKKLYISGRIDEAEFEQESNLLEKQLKHARSRYRSLEKELNYISEETIDLKIKRFEQFKASFIKDDPFSTEINDLLKQIIDVIYYDRQGNDVKLEVRFL